MIGVIASVIDGVLVGAVYGLAAMGLTLIWGVMNVINLTHGAMIVFGMFALYFLRRASASSTRRLPIVIIVGFVFGVALYWIAVHRVIGQQELMSLLGDLRREHGHDRARHRALEHEPLQRSGLAARHHLAGLHLHRHAYHGRAARRVDRGAALSAAVPDPLSARRSAPSPTTARRPSSRAFRPTSVLAMAFGLGVSLAFASGTLIATMFPFTVLSGQVYELKSFVVTVLGGLGNPAGALVGGVALGLIEGLATPFMPVSWTPVIEFGLFVLVLIAFPRGIFAFTRA